MFHLAAYKYSASAQQTTVDVPALTDTILTVRNSHLIVTDPFLLGLAYSLGSTQTEVRANWPTLNSYGYHQFWPLDNQGTTAPVVPDRPALIDYLSQPLVVPQDEELAIQASMNPATTEVDTVFMWFFTPNHMWSIPAGVQRLTLKATLTFTPATAYVWSGAQTLVFETTFRGGWYAIVGMNVEEPASLAARLIFPKATQYNGRSLRPGCLVQSAYGNRPDRRFMGNLGAWGFFNSFEQPYVEVISTVTTARTYDFRFDVVYLGDGPAPTGY